MTSQLTAADAPTRNVDHARIAAFGIQLRPLAAAQGGTVPSEARRLTVGDLARFVAQGGRLVLPWAAIFALSCAMGRGLDQSLVHARNEQAHAAGYVQTTPGSTQVRELPTNESNTRWVRLVSLDGTSVDCISNAETFAADAVVLEPVDFNYMTALLRCYSLEAG